MLKELNRVIEYIEDHITDDISLEMIADYAGVSDYHFRTVFFHLSGLTLSEYIKNRKLSEANKDLLNGERVTDVAFKYSYQSMDGFTRAFKKWSGCLPSEVSKNNIGRSFPKLSFVITIKGGKTMEFRIEEKPAFNFVGVSKRVPMQFEGINNEILKLAQSITEKQRMEMRAIQNLAPLEIVNVSYNADHQFLKEEGELTHLIGVLTTIEETSSQLEKVPVGAHSWVVFPNKGPFPSILQETMAKAYAEWLPASDFELINAPTFSFTKTDSNNKDCAYSEVWIAVRRK
ncbi:AraC family transcriptional regulator [Arcticibacter tournemirensis]|uniref:AraC family transcriptional regulator n=1 Tax=Arcticibacter tournemirensis TaxID=699437 RepID=A0A5M9HK55_9SPHI|nr:AraC family transcriptional regulator [Arcticibacter tournemirensis]KAA8485804.1 AraC family transcriptional regulator [Arcticibacter tournemirensis]TQM46952.1 AraC family transcriptional regulator [Arcticibacter tournemirensis]